MQGTVSAMTAQYPASMVSAAMRSVHAARQGEQVERFIPNEGHPLNEPGRDPANTAYYFVTPDNVADFVPEY